VIQPHNPVPMPRDRAGEYKFNTFLEGIYIPIMKQPKKLVGKLEKRAIVPEVIFHLIQIYVIRVLNPIPNKAKIVI